MDKDSLSIQHILQLSIFAFTMSGQTKLEEYTIKVLITAYMEVLVQCVMTSSGAELNQIFPNEVLEALQYLKANTATTSRELTAITQANSSTKYGEGDEDEWGWDEGSNPNSPLPSPTRTQQHPSISAAEGFTSTSYDQIQSKLILEDYVRSMIELFQECGQLRKEMSKNEDGSRNTTGMLTQLVQRVLDPTKPEISELQHIEDVSEQFTRAGIDLLKSGFSRFGFGGQNFKESNASPYISQPDSTAIFFVIGGITSFEVQSIKEALSNRPDVNIIIGSTCLTTAEKLQYQIFKQ